MAQFVYTMNRVGKIVPPKRQILKDISLSFFPGAKIGVLGLKTSKVKRVRSQTSRLVTCRRNRFLILKKPFAKRLPKV